MASLRPLRPPLIGRILTSREPPGFRLSFRDVILTSRRFAESRKGIKREDRNALECGERRDPLWNARSSEAVHQLPIVCDRVKYAFRAELT